MGVSGCGKSTIGKALSTVWKTPFYDGDDFHPSANIHKMAEGNPLDDGDRQPWLEAIRLFAKDHLEKDSLIIACSALKTAYRDTLSIDLAEKVVFIYLKGTFDLISNRMKTRDHFMPQSLLHSQFDILETPIDAITVCIDRSVAEIIRDIHQHMLSEVGLVGLGVMGRNLSRNLANNGFRMSLYNRRVEGIEEEVAQETISKYSELLNAKGFEDLRAFVQSIERPRKIILMITAGKATDNFINEISDLLNEGDTLVDMGNSFYKDTERRQEQLAHHGIDWIGVGLSGGEEGALTGPAIMPGGTEKSVNRILPILQKIAARDQSNEPCCVYVGRGASGHFVKMVHNGIEYAEMQLIAEVYDLLKTNNGMSADAISDVFEEWSKSDLGSYLLEITIDILRKKAGDQLILDQILDVAAHKGTGSWTAEVAANLGVAIPTLTAALNARFISSDKASRRNLSSVVAWSGGVSLDISQVKSAYAISRMLNHIQGFDLIGTASKKYEWEVDIRKLASIWVNGCIIRSQLMYRLANAPDSIDLMHTFGVDLDRFCPDLGDVVSVAAKSSVAIPCMMSSLIYLQSRVRAQSPANMIQAQRDFFGAHTYQMKDDPDGPACHTKWKIKS